MVDKLNEILECRSLLKFSIIPFSGFTASELVRHALERFIQVDLVDAKYLGNAVRLSERKFAAISEVLELDIHRARNGLHLWAKRRYEAFDGVGRSGNGEVFLAPSAPRTTPPPQKQEPEGNDYHHQIGF
jgi:hypothetical protein